MERIDRKPEGTKAMQQAPPALQLVEHEVDEDLAAYLKTKSLMIWRRIAVRFWSAKILKGRLQIALLT